MHGETLTFCGPFEVEDLDHVVPLFEELHDAWHFQIIINLREVPSIEPAAAVFLGHMARVSLQNGGEIVFSDPHPELRPSLEGDEDLRTIKVFPNDDAAYRYLTDPLGGGGEGGAPVPAPLRPPLGGLTAHAEPEEQDP